MRVYQFREGDLVYIVNGEALLHDLQHELRCA